MIGWKCYTVDSLYLEHPLSRNSIYLELKSQSLCVSRNLFFSLYLELSLSRTNFLVPCEFEIEKVNCSCINYTMNLNSTSLDLFKKSPETPNYRKTIPPKLLHSTVVSSIDVKNVNKSASWYRLRKKLS